MQGNNFEIAVIGGGPSGIAAATQARRFGRNVALFEREKLGGLVRCANLIENFPGFYGRTGAEAVQLLCQQAKRIGINAIFDEVTGISKPEKDAFAIKTANCEYSAGAVIVATGTVPRRILIPELPGERIRYWIEDPREFSEKDVLVVGGGEAALDQAIRLSRFAKSVKIVCRSGLKALPLLAERCAAAGIEIHENAEISGGKILHGRVAVHTSAGEFQCDDIFSFCGRDPEDALLHGFLSENPQMHGNLNIETAIPGLFLAGDLIAGRRRHLAIAIGTGADAAIRAVEHVRGKNAAQMKLLCSKGDRKLAVVHVAQFRNNEKCMAEFVESLSGSRSKDEKWVAIVSSQFGCPVGCRFCDAGDHFHGNLTKEELLAQIDSIVDAHYPDRKIPAKKFKVQFARMGEPMLNPAVLDALEEMRSRYRAPGLMPCISTIAPIGAERQFERLIEIKNKHYHGNFQMQFSIHSTDEKTRDELMPAKKWNLEKIAEYGMRFHLPGDRKVTLNFAVSEQNPVDVEKIRSVFDPAHFAIKLTPVNPTFRASKNRLVAEFGEYGTRLREEFKKAGFETIESVGDLDENSIGSNCGQVLALWKKQKD